MESAVRIMMAPMGRDRSRPDESGKPSYITADGYRRLEEEAHHLWTVERPRMAKAVEVAAAEGDRSENAEYIYSKKKLAEIDRRLKFLGRRLDVLEIVTDGPPRDGRVYFGCWVTLADEGGAEVTYRIVGPDETDPNKGWISVESPVARALLRRAVGDDVEVSRPRGKAVYEITGVHLCDPRDGTG
jgi:transcription elongation factor GreB